MVMTAGGAVASADTGSEAASGATDAAAPSAPQSTRPHGPIARLSESLRTTLRDVTTTVGAVRKPLTQSLTGVTDSVTKSALDTLSSGIAAGTVVTRTVTGVIEPAPRPLAPTNDTVALNPADVAPTAAAVPVVDALASTVNQVASTVDQVASVPASVSTTALTTVQSVVDPVMSGVASLPTNLTAPIPDVISALQSLLTATTDAVTQFTALPTDLASLFGVTGTTPTTGSLGGGGSLVASGWPLAATPLQLIQLLTDSTIAAPLPMVVPLIDVTTALGLASTSAAAASSYTVPGGFEAFIQSAGGLIAIVAVSLSALALAAASGVAGMLASTAAGVRIGYRQAKARMALRASGIARFAVGGPVGVVRSGTLVAFRSRTANVARPGVRSLSRNVA
jgi:hypothetical protein